MKKTFFLMTVLFCAVLSGCGKRGMLDYPDDKAPRRIYPAPVEPGGKTVEKKGETVENPIENNPAMQINVLQGLDMPNAVRDVAAPADNF